MTIDNFINKIREKYNKDIRKNIKYENDNIVLYSDNFFDFGYIFVTDLLKLGLHEKYPFTPIGTSEDNNIHIDSEYYPYFSSYYVTWNCTNDTITLSKNI